MRSCHLDRLCAPLIGIVPYEERLSLRTEAEEHLYALIEDREADGLPASEATETALREQGEPWRNGEQFVEAWCRSHTAETVFTRYMSAATLHAFAFFGIASVACTLLVQYFSLTPYRYTPLLPLSGRLMFLCPIISGILTGVLVPIRPVRAVAVAMGIVLLHSAVVTAVMWPQQGELYLFTAQAAYWFPAGALSALGGAAVSRHLSRTLFLHRWALR